MRILCCFAVMLWTSNRSVSIEPDASGVDVQDCVVRFAEEVEVPALATGHVAEVFVTINQNVAANARLVRLNNGLLLDQRLLHELRIKQAKTQSGNKSELKYAELAKAEAEAELDASRAIHNDFGGAVATGQLRRLQLAVKRGELEIDQAIKRQEEAEIAVDLAEAELSLLDDQLRNLHAEAPLAGVVLEVHKRVGEWVQTGETVATIARMDRLHIHALLDSATIGPEHCAGLPVSVHWTDRASNEARSVRGRVLSVDPYVMPGGRYRLHAEVVNEAMSPANAAMSSAQVWKLLPGAEVSMRVHAPASIANRSRASQDNRVDR